MPSGTLISHHIVESSIADLYVGGVKEFLELEFGSAIEAIVEARSQRGNKKGVFMMRLYFKEAKPAPPGRT